MNGVTPAGIHCNSKQHKSHLIFMSQSHYLCNLKLFIFPLFCPETHIKVQTIICDGKDEIEDVK